MYFTLGSTQGRGSRGLSQQSLFRYRDIQAGQYLFASRSQKVSLRWDSVAVMSITPLCVHSETTGSGSKEQSGQI